MPSVLASLSPTNLSSLMTTLRRDITTHCIDFLLGQAATLEPSSIPSIAGVVEYKLSIFPAPRNSQSLSSRINNISAVLDFLNDHLFPHLPAQAGFLLSLTRPLTRAFLDKFLIPSLPSSTEELPAFLEVVQHAMRFEDNYIHGMLGDVSGGREIETWAASVGSHYEKKRRVQILERARAIIIREDDASPSFRAEIALAQDEPQPTAQSASSPVPEKSESPEDTAWGFDDDDSNETPAAAEEDAWKFDDDVASDAAPEPEPEPREESATPAAHASKEDEPDPDDAWGWNDDEEIPATEDSGASTDSSAWDDPWGDSADQPPPSPKAPKAATRLEKLSNKGKAKETGSDLQSPVPTATLSSKPAAPPPAPQKTAPPPQSQVQRESYVVSGRVKELLWLVEDVIREASGLAVSNILRSQTNISTSQVGSVISQTAALILDLYRGLYPVVASARLASAKGAMGFSNDCFWLAGELAKVLAQPGLYAATKAKLEEARERLKTLAECWYDETVVSCACCFSGLCLD